MVYKWTLNHFYIICDCEWWTCNSKNLFKTRVCQTFAGLLDFVFALTFNCVCFFYQETKWLQKRNHDFWLLRYCYILTRNSTLSVNGTSLGSVICDMAVSFRYTECILHILCIERSVVCSRFKENLGDPAVQGTTWNGFWVLMEQNRWRRCHVTKTKKKKLWTLISRSRVWNSAVDRLEFAVEWVTGESFESIFQL